MQTAHIHLAATLLAATAAVGVLGDEAVFECVISSKSSSLGYSGDTYAPFPAVIVGDFHPTNNPSGTLTRLGVSGGSGNQQISGIGSLSIGGETSAAPSGSFRLLVDFQNLTVSIEDFVLDFFGGVPAQLGAQVMLFTPSTFHTIAPSSVFIGGSQPPMQVGSAVANSLVISQTSAAQGAFLVEKDDNVFGFSIPLEASYALSLTALGQSVRSGEPIAGTMPLDGTLVFGEGGMLSISFEVAHAETFLQPLGIAPFASFPVELPTVLPPGQSAGLLITGGAPTIEVSMGLSGSIVASGTLEEREGDVDQDQVVGVDDLTLVLSSWGLSGPTDLDQNGTTDAIDLALVLHNWG